MRKKSQFNFMMADKAAHNQNNQVMLAKNGGITFHGDPLDAIIANCPSINRSGHGKGGPTKWKKPEDCVDPWAEIQRRRKEGDPLMLGGQCRDLDRYPVAASTISKGKGLSNSRRKIK